jgi:hypothetical protein
MSASKLPHSSHRYRLAQSLPALFVGVGFYVYFPGMNLFGRVGNALVAGVFTTALATMAALISTFIVAKIAGREDIVDEFLRNDLRVTATVLLFVAALALGQFRSAHHVKDILQCIDDAEQRGWQNASVRPKSSDLVRWCDAQSGSSESTSDDDDDDE